MQGGEDSRARNVARVAAPSQSWTTPAGRPLSAFMGLKDRSNSTRGRSNSNHLTAFAANATPPLDKEAADRTAFGDRHPSIAGASEISSAGKDASQAQRRKFVHVTEEETDGSAKHHRSGRKTADPVITSAPAPAIPDELLAALAQEYPRQHVDTLTPASSSSSMAQLPSITPYSPFVNDDLWSANLKTPTPASSLPLPKSAHHRLQGGAESSQSLSVPGTPAVIPPTPSPSSPLMSFVSDGSVSPRVSVSSRQGLKKAASAESLRKHVQAGQGLGIGMGTEPPSDFQAGPPFRPDLQARSASTPSGSGSASDIKTIWKSLSSRLNKGKERERHQYHHPQQQEQQSTALVRPKSMESGRHSLSVYPRRELVRRRSTASTASDGSAQSIRDIARDILKRGASSGKALEGVVSQTKPHASTGPEKRGPGPAEVDAEVGNDTSAWLQRETFVHDLVHRRRERGKRPSTANLKRTASWAENQGRLGIESALPDSGDEDSELSDVASLVSFMDFSTDDALREAASGLAYPAATPAQTGQTEHSPSTRGQFNARPSPNTQPAQTSPRQLREQAISDRTKHLPEHLSLAAREPIAAPAPFPGSPSSVSSPLTAVPRLRCHSDVSSSSRAERRGIERGSRTGPPTPIKGVQISELPMKVRSRSNSSNLLKELSSPRKSPADFVIAVVGPRQVGKSWIIENNLRQSGATSSVLYEDELGNKVVSYIGKFSVLGVSRMIELIEVDMDILNITSEGLVWPKYLPKLDGAMLCYKHGNPRALGDLTTLLNGFWTRGGVALIALATQCKPLPEGKRPEADKAAEICNIHGAGLVHLDGGIDDPGRKAKNSLQWVLRRIMDARGGIEDARGGSPTRLKRSKSSGPIPLNAKISAVPLRPSHSPESAVIARSHTTDASESRESVASSGDQIDPTKFSQTDIYLSREDLIQKFLFAVVTGNDDQHVSIFFIIYRRIARPFEVLSRIIDRYMYLENHIESDPLLSRFAQMKLCNALALWLERHPGDFCGSATLGLLHNFLDILFASNWVHQYAIELEQLIKTAETCSDAETAWALPDITPLDSSYTMTLPDRRPSVVTSVISMSSSGTSATGSSSAFVPNPPDTPLTPTAGSDSPNLSLSPSTDLKAAASRILRNRSYSDADTTASSEVPPSVDSSQSLAGRPASQRHTLLIEASNLVAETPISRLAQQITKISWDIFSSMQPRDLLRYVMAPRDPDNPGAPPTRNANDPVGRSIAFGTYLSNWIATLILVQKRSSLRLKMIEHFIRLASSLRDLDNYDCLMAVLAGLNSQPVHRLDVVADGLPPELYKKFRSLNRLMSTDKSFASYRLAILNAKPDMIPYLGIHLQDITRLHDGKSDMRDGLVNWTKMRQIGKHCAIVTDCSRLTPHYQHEDNLQRLVADLPVYLLDSDTLYDLSYLYKPRQQRSASNPMQAQKAKLKKLFFDTLSPH